MNNETVNAQYSYEMPRKGAIPSPESSMSPGYPPDSAFRGNPNNNNNNNPNNPNNQHHHLHQTTGYVSK
uniref:Uncharacterized protein n=1 Tax=Tetranychus urticae TaxID=32264 RepID=T1KPN9_TETUR